MYVVYIYIIVCQQQKIQTSCAKRRECSWRILGESPYVNFNAQLSHDVMFAGWQELRVRTNSYADRLLVLPVLRKKDLRSMDWPSSEHEAANVQACTIYLFICEFHKKVYIYIYTLK